MGINTSRTLNPTQANINTNRKLQRNELVHDDRIMARMLLQVFGGLEIVFSGVSMNVAARRIFGRNFIL
jgi:hypothetical protein